MPTDRYIGISHTHEAVLKASGSRFLGFLFPVRDWEHAKGLLDEFREKYADATHVCYGCVLGVEREEQRFSDDGEPSNSAGRPILNNILSSGVTNVLGIVVRYYGGKKLGIPGLIAAYGGAMEACLDQAELVEIQEMEQIICRVDLAVSYHLYNYLERRSDLSYTVEDGLFTIQCPKSLTPRLRHDLNKIPTLAFENKV